MDQDIKKKLITIAIGFLIFTITYFIVKSKYIKSKPTGYKRTVIVHKDGNVKDKITFDETYSNFQMGFFILVITAIILFSSTYLLCFKESSSDYTSSSISPSSSIISSSLDSITPLE